MSRIACLCCGEPMDVTRTKVEKPYVKCDECRVQIFVKGGAGVKRFEAKYGTAWRGGAPVAATAPVPAKKAAPVRTEAPPKKAAPAPVKKADPTPPPVTAGGEKKKGGLFGF